MQYTVSDFTGPLTPEQRDVLDSLLLPGERVLWATRPKASLYPWSHGDRTDGSLIAVVVLYIFCGMALSEAWRGVPQCWVAVEEALSGDGSWVHAGLACLLLAAVLLAAYLSGRFPVVMMIRMFMVRRYRRHTLYVLTDKRALSIMPTPEGWKTASFSLDEDMILARRDRRAGGELIFRGLDTAMEEGWHGLPDREGAEHQIMQALRDRA